MSVPHSDSRAGSVLAPPKGRYRLLALLDAPKRIVKPGCLCEPRPTSPAMGAIGSPKTDRYNGVTAGEVRGGRVKLCELQLADVLEGRLQPPLTLKDFEDFLAFKTKSAENLYFCVAFDKYRKLYSAHSAATRPYADTIALGDLYRLIIGTFFHPSSPLELNVSSDLRRALDQQIQTTAATRLVAPGSTDAGEVTESFLHPSAFSEIYSESSESLAVSFKAWLLNQSRNADRNRGWFAMFLGLATYVLGLVPTIVACRLDLNRGYRAIGLFFWWFGIVVFVGGLRKTCLVIYLFGDSRQLYPWESARQQPTSATSSAFGAPDSPSEFESSLGTPSTHYDHDLKNDSPHTKGSTEGSPRPGSGYFPDFNFFPLTSTQSTAESTKTATSATGSGLYFAPKSIIDSGLPTSSKVWAPFTRVMEPIVCRAQRDIVAAAAGYGLIAMCLTAVVCFAVPNAHHN